MFQTINGIEVYVVDLTAGVPEPPIHSLDHPELAPYAQALDAAIRQGTVSQPGKYAIHFIATYPTLHWVVFAINEHLEDTPV